jgi:hypothetical protein
MHAWVRAMNVKIGRRDERNPRRGLRQGNAHMGHEQPAPAEFKARWSLVQPGDSGATPIANKGLHGLVQRPSAIGRSASGGAHRLEEFGNLDLETVAVARQQLRRGENV